MRSMGRIHARLRAGCYLCQHLRRNQAFGHTRSLPLFLGRRLDKRTYSSLRKVLDYPWLRNHSKESPSSITTASLLAGTVVSLVYYNIWFSTPVRLESDVPEEEFLNEREIDQRYSPPIVPMTIEQANEALRWEESSHIVGRNSGVNRFDTVRVPSNSPPEDELVSASGHEDDEIKWCLWGVFDGHA